MSWATSFNKSFLVTFPATPPFVGLIKLLEKLSFLASIAGLSVSEAELPLGFVFCKLPGSVIEAVFVMSPRFSSLIFRLTVNTTSPPGTRSTYAFSSPWVVGIAMTFVPVLVLT